MQLFALLLINFFLVLLLFSGDGFSTSTKAVEFKEEKGNQENWIIEMKGISKNEQGKVIINKHICGRNATRMHLFILFKLPRAT